MLKTITKSAMFSSLVLGLMSVTNQVALAAAKCTVNGQEVDCAELGNKIKGFLAWGIGGFLLIAALVIWATVFWIMIVGALIYYFLVKRKFANSASSFRAPTPMR